LGVFWVCVGGGVVWCLLGWGFFFFWVWWGAKSQPGPFIEAGQSAKFPANPRAVAGLPQQKWAETRAHLKDDASNQRKKYGEKRRKPPHGKFTPKTVFPRAGVESSQSPEEKGEDPLVSSNWGKGGIVKEGSIKTKLEKNSKSGEGPFSQKAWVTKKVTVN